jgi:hypothetical protein
MPVRKGYVLGIQPGAVGRDASDGLGARLIDDDVIVKVLLGVRQIVAILICSPVRVSHTVFRGARQTSVDLPHPRRR